MLGPLCPAIQSARHRQFVEPSIDGSSRSIYILNSTEMQKNKTSPDMFLPLKPHWFYILLALAGEEQHGYGIMHDVLDRTGGKVRLWPATLYGTIKRLEEAELIEEPTRRPAPESDDERRRYYRLTRLGRQVLSAETRRLEELLRAARGKSGTLPERATES